MMDEPDHEILDKTFRPMLLEEKQQILEQSEGSSADRAPVQLDQQSVGRLSRMDSMQMQAMAKAVEQRRRARLSRIEQALARLDAGDFGNCGSCGEFIGTKRLQIDPAAVACVECASGRAGKG